VRHFSLHFGQFAQTMQSLQLVTSHIGHTWSAVHVFLHGTQSLHFGQSTHESLLQISHSVGSLIGKLGTIHLGLHLEQF